MAARWCVRIALLARLWLGRDDAYAYLSAHTAAVCQRSLSLRTTGVLSSASLATFGCASLVPVPQEMIMYEMYGHEKIVRRVVAGRIHAAHCNCN